MRFGFSPGVFLVLILFLSSCSGSETNFSEAIPEYSRDAIYEFRKIEEKNPFPEAVDLLGKSAAVFSVVIASDAPRDLVTLMHQQLIEKLSNTGMYPRLLNDEELNGLLSKNPQLTQFKELYLDSLTVVSVSDKDISNPLGRYLNSENLIVFQLDRWPCLDCNSEKSIRMKLRLVDAETSLIIWTGIIEKKGLKTEEMENLEKIATDLASELTQQFYTCFMKKWHRKRFDNLTQAAG